MPLESAEKRWGAPYLVVHRADLQRALLETVAREGSITPQTEAAVAGFAPGSGGVAVAIAQGAVRLKVAGDCLIGADGLRSFVRQRLRGDALRFSGRTAWRATVEAARVPVSMRRKETNLWLGRKAHLVHYPLRGGAIVNVVAIVDEDFHPDEKEFSSSPGEPGFLEARFVRWDETARNCPALLLRGRNGRSLIAIQPQVLSWPPHADRRCGASHAALPGPGRCPGDRRYGRFRQVFARGQTIEARLLRIRRSGCHGRFAFKKVTPASYDLSSRRSSHFSAGYHIARARA